MEDAFTIGIYTGLLGKNDRDDGGDKRDPFLTDTLGRYVQRCTIQKKYRGKMQKCRPTCCRTSCVVQTKESKMNRTAGAIVAAIILFSVVAAGAAEPPISEATQECIDCHSVFHPGIVADWQNSRHAGTTPAAGLTVDELSRRISTDEIPDRFKDVAVGCAECHTLRNDAHADAFDHNGTDIHVVVSPADCATCHPVESQQYSQNIMAHARKNLSDNKVYNDLQRTILGNAGPAEEPLRFTAADPLTRADACYYCHGTHLKVTGTETRETEAGELEFPVIQGWPNQGVGRVNPDNSLGTCSACHTRHHFSIETARKPHTCKECHVGPDVPAYKVYTASKHGNIFSSQHGNWDFAAVPWKIGEDFTAPTCATCHISLTVNADGDVVNQRTHQMSDRLAWRIFGLIYAHPQPKGPDTTVIRNRDGLPLPTDFNGGIAETHLIDGREQAKRRLTMQNTCLNCHASSWTIGYFNKLDHVIEKSNQSVHAATRLMQAIWQKGLARGVAVGESPFDEYVERRWTDAWLLYANNIRFVSAMAGGGDYGVFEDGRYHLTKTLMEMQDWLESRGKTR